MSHNHSKKGAWSPEYYSWTSMVQRCGNPARNNYYLYGGRGIKVCDRWRLFANFLRDMGARPKGSSLDRKRVNGDYELNNCKWSTKAEQNRNRRNSKLTEGCVERIFDLRRCDTTLKAIGNHFSVSRVLIGHIIQGKTWRTV